MHERAINKINKYLIGTSEKGIIFKLDLSNGLEYFVDIKFTGSWNKSDVINTDTVISRTGNPLT